VVGTGVELGLPSVFSEHDLQHAAPPAGEIPVAAQVFAEVEDGAPLFAAHHPRDATTSHFRFGRKQQPRLDSRFMGSDSGSELTRNSDPSGVR
jgi:hypothetical protein